MAIFYENGTSLGSSAGWGGYNGNNYVVCYPFTTGSSGASYVTLPLNNIWTKKGSGSATFGFKIGTYSTQYASAYGITPDSNSSSLSYSGGTYGYTATLSASCNLLPNTTYYLFVYVVSNIGNEYYAGTWNLTAPNITTSGSYTSPDSSLSSISSSVTTQQNVSIVMNNPSSLTHNVVFSYSGTTLASASFTTTLDYTCPRSWFAQNISVTSMSITATITIASSGKTVATRSFMLYADSGMVPVVPSTAIAASADNGESSFTNCIAGVSKAIISFNTNGINMDATAGAAIRSYSVTINGTTYSGKNITTDVLQSSCTARCTVTDSRGRSGYYDLSITVTPYTAPSLNNMKVYRCDASGNESENGAYISFKASSTYTSISDGTHTNSATITASYRVEGQSSWTELTSSLPSGTATIYYHGNTQDALSALLKVTDTVGQSKEYETQLAHEQWMLCFRSGGDGAAIGMSASIADQLSIPSDWDYASGAAKFGYDKMVLVSGKHYGTAEPASAISSPVTGQVYFKVVS